MEFCEIVDTFYSAVRHTDIVDTLYSAVRHTDIVDTLYSSVRHTEITTIKVKVSLEQATKAQRGSRGIAVLFL